jgi:hypothetical protein
MLGPREDTNFRNDMIIKEDSDSSIVYDLVDILTSSIPTCIGKPKQDY